jgi:UDP-N-acetylmuramoylalanine--D-glutamate ligase
MKSIKDRIEEEISGRSILILGFGREGRSTYKTLRGFFPKLELCIADKNVKLANDKELQDDSYTSWVLGEGYMKALPLFDLIYKTPGISLTGYQKPSGQIISSQTDLFIKLFGKQIIGVTGTKGKSTTVSLIHHILTAYGLKSFLVGNIGVPALEIVDYVDEDTTIIYELSSHQLEFCKNSPHIAVFLNLFEEHLDHYISFLAYQMAKVSITKYQTANDYLIYSLDNLLLSNRIKECENKATKVAFSISKKRANSYVEDNKLVLNDGRVITMDVDRIPLAGKHNLQNILAAFNACVILGLDTDKMLTSLYDFTPLPHRLEWVGEYEGISFVNDSIATIPEATISAIKTYDDLDTIILGGFNRCIDYSLLVEYLKKAKLKNIILTGEVGEMIKNELDAIDCKSNIFMANNMDEIVRLAYEYTAKGKLCLLSPAASSYDNFKNFEDRGDQYKKKVREFVSHP